MWYHLHGSAPKRKSSNNWETEPILERRKLVLQHIKMNKSIFLAGPPYTLKIEKNQASFCSPITLNVTHIFRQELRYIQLDFQNRKIMLNNFRFQCLVPFRNGFEYLVTQKNWKKQDWHPIKQFKANNFPQSIAQSAVNFWAKSAISWLEKYLYQLKPNQMIFIFILHCLAI